MTDDRAVVDAMADHLMHRYGASFTTRPAAIGCARSMIALMKIVGKPRWRFFRRRAGCDHLAVVVPVIEGERCTLGDCPPGLFRWEDTLCFKSEYYSIPGKPDAYVVASGEYFWGGTSGDLAARLALVVTPIEER